MDNCGNAFTTGPNASLENTLTKILFLAGLFTTLTVLLIATEALAFPNNTGPDQIITAHDKTQQPLIVGDFNGDELPDILSSSYDTSGDRWGNYQIFLQKNDSTFQSSPNKSNNYKKGIIAPSVCKGDFNSDELDDFVLAMQVNKIIQIRFQDNNTGIPNSPNVEFGVSSVGNLRCADFNGDNKTDIIYSQTTKMQIHLQNESQNVSTVPDITINYPDAIYFEIFDINNDGLNDIIIWNESMYIYYQRVDRTFTKDYDDIIEEEGGKLLFDDYNQDGLIDILRYSSSDEWVMLFYQNRSTGLFQDTPHAKIKNTNDRIRSIQTGDVNNDGWQDIVFVFHDTTSALRICFRNQDGTWPSSLTSLILANQRGPSATLADLNNDELPDIVANANTDTGRKINIYYQEPVNRSAPIPTISLPQIKTTFDYQEAIQFSAIGTYDNDSTYLRYSWFSNLQGWLSNGISFSKTLILGKHVVTLYVTDIKHNVSIPINITVLPPNSPPVIIITSPLNSSSYYDIVKVQFDASSSYDPDNDQLSHLWILEGGVTLSNQATFSKRFDVGNYTVNYWLNDNNGTNVSKSISFSVRKSTSFPPKAVINAPLEGDEYISNLSVVIDGTNSSDPDGNNLTYYWISNLSGFISNKVNDFIELPIGEHQITLWVDDGNGFNISSQVNISVIYFNPNEFSVDSPNPSTTVSGTITVKGTAALHTKAINIWVDDGDHTWISMSENWEYQLNTKSISNGPHNITLGFKNTEYNIYIITIPVIVNNPKSSSQEGDEELPLIYIILGLVVLIAVGGLFFVTNVMKRSNMKDMMPPGGTPRSYQAPKSYTSIQESKEVESKEPQTTSFKPDMATIQCPGCQAKMKVPKLNQLQDVICNECGLEGKAEI